jgi:hypothetical protein
MPKEGLTSFKEVMWNHLVIGAGWGSTTQKMKTFFQERNHETRPNSIYSWRRTLDASEGSRLAAKLPKDWSS